MTDLHDFVGTWRVEQGAPFSTHTFTWVLSGDGLRGEWIIEAAPTLGRPPLGPDAKPRQTQMPISEPTLDEGRLLFNLKGTPFISEFRLVNADDAVVGAALDRIPAEFAGPEYRPSIEGHRIRLRKIQPAR